MTTRVWRPPLNVTIGHSAGPVELIPVGPPHRGLLADAFSDLSDRSRYLRFMAPLSRLSESDLSYLTELDMVDRFAWGILVDGRPAAVGRYVRVADGSTTAEVALTVLDDFQGMGLGTLLVECLAVVARDRGYATFSFEVLAENRAMLRILDKLGAAVEAEAGVVHAEVDLDAIAAPPIGARALMEVVASAGSVEWGRVRSLPDRDRGRPS